MTQTIESVTGKLADLYVIVGLLVILVLVGCGASPVTAPAATPTVEIERTETDPHVDTGSEDAHSHDEEGNANVVVEMPHIHGIGYTADGSELQVAAHDGLRVYHDGKWLAPDLPLNDYMGFSAVDEGFYSSGHPGPDSSLVNPLGLVKSTDGGETLEMLGFKGESDFHLMGAGYNNHAVYVFNPAPNSQLEVGLYYTLDEGKTWTRSALEGLTTQPIQLAVHPTKANIVALATEGGLLLSVDSGNRFALVSEPGPVAAVTFPPAGDQMLFGFQSLHSYDLATGNDTLLNVPELAADDGVAYLAVNPARPDEITLATFQRHIYRSTDGGKSWQQIAQAGKGL